MKIQILASLLSRQITGLHSSVAIASPIATRHRSSARSRSRTPGTPPRRRAFLEGVKDLHSFQFDEAAVAFQRAQKADPVVRDGVLGRGDEPQPSAVGAAGRRTPRRRSSRRSRRPRTRGRRRRSCRRKRRSSRRSTSCITRRATSSRATPPTRRRWRRCTRSGPTDHEVATWYALSLLGTVRPADKGFRRQALAASIAEKVFAENPKHPGAAHFIIHAFDDPDHAPLGLTAARAYAGIAPSAAHALHMPSHIFVQRGMWEDVRKSNIVAYKSATELNARMKLAEGREDFHTLGWLEYANLMLGNIDEAKANVESAKQAARSQSRQRRHPQRLSRHARAVDSRDREVGEDRARGAAPHRPPGRSQRTPACRAWRCRTAAAATPGRSSPATARRSSATSPRPSAAEAMLTRRPREGRRRIEPLLGQADRDHGKAGRRAACAMRGDRRTKR